MELIKYNEACRAIAEAKSVDEVKRIRNIAEAMRVFARQAQNLETEVDAAEVRIRAEEKTGKQEYITRVYPVPIRWLRNNGFIAKELTAVGAQLRLKLTYPTNGDGNRMNG